MKRIIISAMFCLLAMVAVAQPPQDSARGQRGPADKNPFFMDQLFKRFMVKGYAQGGYTYLEKDERNPRPTFINTPNGLVPGPPTFPKSNTFDMKRAYVFCRAQITDRWFFWFMYDFCGVVNEYYLDFAAFKGGQMNSWVRNGFFSLNRPVWHAGLRSDIVDLYKEAIRTATQQMSGFQQRLGGLVAHLLSLAWFYGRNEAFSEVADQINRAKILISEQFRTITPVDVAQQLCMGYSNFRRIFKEYTGFSPAKYIQEVKMGKVKEALTNSTRPVKQVAYEMGYENEDYFFTAFRRLTGMTPVEYRKFTQGKRKG
jgi:AraC-like DNA-binding protein